MLAGVDDPPTIKDSNMNTLGLMLTAIFGAVTATYIPPKQWYLAVPLIIAVSVALALIFN